MTTPYYMPILRAKEGETEALARLSPITKSCITPLIDIPKPKANDSDPLSEFLCKKITALSSSWGTEHPILLDMSRYAPNMRTESNVHPISLVFKIANQCKLQAIPVTGTHVSRGPEFDYLDAVSEIVKKDRRGVALRFQYDEIADPQKTQEVVERTRQQLNTDITKCDVIFDVEAIDRLSLDKGRDDLVTIFRSAVQSISGKQYRSVAVCGSSIPEQVGKKFDTKPCQVDRVELAAWKILNGEKKIPRIVFGDYGIVYPFQSDGGAPVRPPSRIRLSTESKHILYRAPPGSYQHLRVKVAAGKSMRLIADCWGKRSIIGRGSGFTGVGNPSKWVATDTNIHIVGTVRLLRSELSNFERLTPSESATQTSDTWLQDELELADT